MFRFGPVLVMFFVVLAAAAGQARAAEGAFGQSQIFARVPTPGHPESVIIDGIHVYVGTTVNIVGTVAGDPEPSRVFEFNRETGDLAHEYVVQGEDLSKAHGVAGTAFDSLGRLYAAQGPTPAGQGVYRFTIPDNKPFRQALPPEIYARIPNLKPCVIASAPCSPTTDDLQPFTNDLAFDAAGNLYVTDSWQATIFRVPPGGGDGRVWFQDARLHDPVIGPNGIRLSPDGQHLYFAVTAASGLKEGKVYRLPLVDRPTADDLKEVANLGQARPDGLAFGASGKLYVVLGSANEVRKEGLAILRPDGSVEARIASEYFFNPSSLEFDNSDAAVLVTNHDLFNPTDSHSYLVKVFVNDRGAPRIRPSIP